MNALEVLESHQQQIDGTGGMVGVSRQALDELIADYKQVSINLGATEEAFTDFRGKVAGKVCGLCDIHDRAYCYANTEKLETRITELEKEQSNLEIPYFLRQPGAVEEDVRKHIDELKQKLAEYEKAFKDLTMEDQPEEWGYGKITDINGESHIAVNFKTGLFRMRRLGIESIEFQMTSHTEYERTGEVNGSKMELDPIFYDADPRIAELEQKLSEYDNAFQDMRDIYCESTISNDGSASLMYQVIRRLNKPLRRSIEGDSSEMSHKCHAIGCDELCDPEKLMCLKHWKMLPRLRRASVLREYRAGQCLNDPTPSPQWHDAADAAIYWVHIVELRAELALLKSARIKSIGDQKEHKEPQESPGLSLRRFLKGRQIAIEEDGDEIIHLPEKCVLWACEFSGKNIKLIKGKDGDWVCPNCGYSYGEPEE